MKIDRSTTVATAFVLSLASCGIADGSNAGLADDPDPVIPGPVDDDDDPVDPVDPQLDPLAAGPLPGLRSVAPDANSFVVEWRRPSDNYELALFHSSERETVFDGEPSIRTLRGNRIQVNGFRSGETVHFGLGVRQLDSEHDYLPAGPTLCARTGAPLYVDSLANPEAADGLSPATAYPQPLTAILIAFSQGGGNVWVRSGTYAGTSLPLFPAVHVYGGFDESFDPLLRAPEQSPTILVAGSGQPIVSVQNGDLPAILDGVELDARGVASVGLDSEDTPLELRQLRIRNAVTRGIRLRGSESGAPVRVTLCDVESSQHGADGLSANGAFNLTIDGSRFDSNVQEGLDLDDLVAPNNEDVELWIRDSGFFGNGAQGVDVDLAAPALLGADGGTFGIRVEGCRFELNGEEGLLLDVEYEFAPLWSSNAIVSGCLLRANRSHGMRIDADANIETLIRGVLAVANARSGMSVTSESFAGSIFVAGSVFSGNREFGVQASLGNQALVVADCILTGNSLGGVDSRSVPSSVSGTIAYLQPEPFEGATTVASHELSSAHPPELARVPEAFAAVVALDGSSATLDAPLGSEINALPLAEWNDDGTSRSHTSLDTTRIELDPAPALFLGGATLAFYSDGDDTRDDYRLIPGAALGGMGFTLTGSPARDPGPANLLSNIPPGTLAPATAAPFWWSSVQPAPASSLALNDSITLSFRGGAIDSATVEEVRVTTAEGERIGVEVVPSDIEIVIVAPRDGWPTVVCVEVHANLRSQQGIEIANPTCVRLQR